MTDKRVVFMGTPDFAVPVLKMLIENTNLLLVVTQPDKEVGRKKEKQFSPVKREALENNIPVFQPNRIRKDYEEIKRIKPDLIVTCAYGQIIPKEVLDIPKYGSINVHASLLPKYRGAAPIQWALLNGEEKTGITLMYMDEGMDTGDIFKQAELSIDDTDDILSLHEKLSLLGSNLLKDNLNDIFMNKTIRIKQNDSLATYAPMIKREDEHLSFNAKGIDIINKIRALSPWPLANIILNDKEIKIIKAEFKKESVAKIGLVKITKNSLAISCKDGYIYLLEIKPFGKKQMNINSYLNGINKDSKWVVNNEE